MAWNLMLEFVHWITVIYLLVVHFHSYVWAEWRLLLFGVAEKLLNSQSFFRPNVQNHTYTWYNQYIDGRFIGDSKNTYVWHSFIDMIQPIIEFIQIRESWKSYQLGLPIVDSNCRNSILNHLPTPFDSWISSYYQSYAFRTVIIWYCNINKWHSNRNHSLFYIHRFSFAFLANAFDTMTLPHLLILQMKYVHLLYTER